VNAKQVTFELGQEKITLETGVLAKQAQASVLVTMGDTVILVTVGAASAGGEIKKFFPLMVECRKRAYATGAVPGGFFKRESRLTEQEVLTSRAIDRSLRPCFPKNFYDEVQVLAIVLSQDPTHLIDVPALIGASAALHLSGLPYQGPVAAARVGREAGEFIINPTLEQLADSDLDILISGKKDSVIMVEADAQELSEEVMLSGIMHAHQQMQGAIESIETLKASADENIWNWIEPSKIDTDIADKIAEDLRPGLLDAYTHREKKLRSQAIRAAKEQVILTWTQPAEDGSDRAVVSGSALNLLINSVEHTLVRKQVADAQQRIDGRDFNVVRPITTATSLLPRTHGSALFTRGETQALVTVTLGNERDAQLLDGGGKEAFMLHYNFPPFCVGEVGFMGAPKRREIGHGNLAKRAVSAVLPGEDACPYVLRLVSEVLESNGSSSMATVCGASMALMDAGIKIRAPVAGIAMGLLKQDDEYMILSDILGDEDHLGDMDFKVAGTAAGVTALQMDIKISGLDADLLKKALLQAREGRLHILEEMAKTLSQSRQDLSLHAPRIEMFPINPERIRDVIGRGGATIREITEQFEVEIDISDDGMVKLCARNDAGLRQARARIDELTADVEVGSIYTGRVVKIMDFGAFISLLPGKDGFLHISQIANERVENISDHLTEGQDVTVKAIEIDKQGRVRVSIKALQTEISG
jgi:polyribonucleotide nucleotidyltransferase